ncbi:type IV toxin-antitoxin system AbiEi family antitoxin domain-containing protein [Pectobacteriaceae bacterium CE90]|nr:type IV toxin-antitoxin system AbiEi family antitoxin domain-containing protein [Pectobacteriaceae bacterium CE90]
MQDDKYLRQDNWQVSLPPLHYSCPEKAILELLATVPNTISFEHADQLMQGLHNLSPRKLRPVTESLLRYQSETTLSLADRETPTRLAQTPDTRSLCTGHR